MCMLLADGHTMNSSIIEYHRPPGLPGVELLYLEDPKFAFKPHIHDGYVFWFNGQGGESVSIGGCSDILQPDSFGVVAPGEVHANHAVTEHRTLQSFYVEQAVVDDVANQRGAATAGFRSRLQQDRHGRALLAGVHQALMVAEDGFFVRETFIRAFSLLLDRHGEGRGGSSWRSDPVKVRMARTILDERFSEPLELDEVASLCGCSACHLIRLFRRETGMTPHAYLMERRLAHARELLAGRLPISSIAFDAGFSDQSHLTRRFRSRFGLTPYRYRQQILR